MITIKTHVSWFNEIEICYFAWVVWAVSRDCLMEHICETYILLLWYLCLKTLWKNTSQTHMNIYFCSFKYFYLYHIAVTLEFKCQWSMFIPSEQFLSVTSETRNLIRNMILRHLLRVRKIYENIFIFHSPFLSSPWHAFLFQDLFLM